jgi:acetyltransferase-like isoleucine patch superfamily enzyme
VSDAVWDDRPLPPGVVVGERTAMERRRETFARVAARSGPGPGLVIGAGCRVYTWTTFSVEPEARLDIGDDCVLVGGTFMCAERIVLGRGVVVSYDVVIADCDFHPMDPELRRRDAEATAPGRDRSQRPPLTTRPVAIGDGVELGVRSVVLKGVTIGDGARVAPGAVVTIDIPAGATAAGVPAEIGDR